MARYLVTGGGGFIGSNLVHALLAEGHNVRVVDNFSTGRRENLADVLDRIELIEGSVTEPDIAARAVAGVTYVLHQAAIPSVPRSVQDPIGTHHSNVLGTLVMLEAARQEGIKRFVFAASSSAYGEKAPGEPKSETMMPHPLSPYAVQKLSCEHYLRVYYEVHKLPTVALRYFNVFGARQDPKSQYAAAIPNFVTAALQNRPATVFGDGGQSRDFCYIDNVVEANMKACTVDAAAGELFNIACGHAVTLLEVIDTIGRIVGNKVAPHHEPPRAGDIRHSLADVSKAKRVLGYQGKIDFAAGIEKTIAWYRRA
jgi:UDP-glucose 4-epimerase